jgi:hypothetical protein
MKLKEFFIQLLTASSGLSSKRFISLVALVVFCLTVFACWFITVPEYAIWALVTVILGGGAMTLAQPKQ